MSGNGQSPPEPSAGGAAPPSTPADAVSPSRTEPEIEAAVRALQAGAGPDAFEVIYRRYFESLYYFFANRGDLPQDAEEMAQSTLLTAYRNIRDFRFDSAFTTWLWKIGKNLWLNRDRDRKAIKRGAGDPTASLVQQDGEGEERELELEDRDFHGTPRGLVQEKAVLERERTRILRQAMADLPPGQRRCLELRVGEDLKYEEVARRLGVSLGTVRSQLAAARRQLRPVLREHFGDSDL